MSAPVFNILTQKEIVIDLSRPAMAYIIAALSEACNLSVSSVPWTPDVECEIDNFRNTLHNLLERSELEPEPENFDLIGD